MLNGVEMVFIVVLHRDDGHVYSLVANSPLMNTNYVSVRCVTVCIVERPVNPVLSL